MATWGDAITAFKRHTKRGDDTDKRFYAYACPKCGRQVRLMGTNMEDAEGQDGECQECAAADPQGLDDLGPR
jgi:DNA-directed RNA polymerase subunit RPC12/RpoP